MLSDESAVVIPAGVEHNVLKMSGMGAVLSALGAFAFILNIWRTMNGPEALCRIEQAPVSRRPPIQ